MWTLRSCFILLLQKETPLANAAFWAARRGNLALLRLLLNSGRVDVDCRDSVWTNSFGIRMPRARRVPLVGMRAPPKYTSLHSAHLLFCICLLYPFQKVQGTVVNLKIYRGNIYTHKTEGGHNREWEATLHWESELADSKKERVREFKPAAFVER